VTATAIPFLDVAGITGLLADELELAWKTVVTHGRYVAGPEVDVFEEDFAHFCGCPASVGVGNGTDALELIFAGLAIGRGDEVIVPANTFVATAEAVCRAGARPRFVDVLPDTLEVDPDAVAAAVGPRTAAVVAVHLYGQPADMERLTAVAHRHGLALIEDAAQAHGARFAGRRTGGLGVAAAFSFYPGKNLGALGDGGAVVSHDRALIERIRSLANHGRSSAGWYDHDVRGRNSRLDTLQAAVLSAKLRHLDAHNARRRAVMRGYRRGLPDACVPLAEHPLAEAVHHLAVVQVPDRDAVTAALDAAGIGWGLHYPVPCHQQRAFRDFTSASFPVTEQAAARIISLPMSPTLVPADVERVCAVLQEVYR
jgi:dTDP-4-amino-4,6-dideoxygalactose transaminase